MAAASLISVPSVLSPGTVPLPQEKLGHVATLRSITKQASSSQSSSKGEVSVTLQLSLPPSSDIRRSELSFDFPISSTLSSDDRDRLACEWVAIFAAEVKAMLSSIDSPDLFKGQDLIANDGSVICDQRRGSASSLNDRDETKKGEISRAEIYSKFQVSQGSLVCTFGDPVLFHRGLDAHIGAPDFRVEIAIRAEHCGSADSDDEFQTFNYGGTVTTPRLEYEFVAEPDLSRKDYPGMTGAHPRRPIKLESLRSHQYFNCLTRAELLALRLFTGPMYMKYNAVLRQFPPSVHGGLKGNQYRTTIHAIVSGVIKLSQCTVLPPSRKVYRGLGGMLLPDRFWQPDEFGCRGGVDFGFMSTTSNEDVAIMYSGRASSQLSTIFEIDVGQIDRGASISWLSQYPEEEEFLVPPLSNLEVIESPRLKRLISGSEILVLKLRVNVNVKSKTMDELIATRRRLHIDTMKNLLSETERELAVDPRDGSALTTFKSLIASEEQRAAEYFNIDENFRKCQEDMINIKFGTINHDALVRLCQRLLQGRRCNSVEDQRFADMQAQREAFRKTLSEAKFQTYFNAERSSNEAFVTAMKDVIHQLSVMASPGNGRNNDNARRKIDELLQLIKSQEWMDERLFESFSTDVYEALEVAKKVQQLDGDISRKKREMDVIDVDQERGARIAARERAAYTTARNALQDAASAAWAAVESDRTAMGMVYYYALVEEELALSSFPAINPSEYFAPWTLQSPSLEDILERDAQFSKPLVSAIDGLKFALFPLHDQYRSCILGLRLQREMIALQGELEGMKALGSNWFHKQRSNFARRAKAVQRLIDVSMIKHNLELVVAEDEKHIQELPTCADALVMYLSMFDETSTSNEEVLTRLKAAFPDDRDIVENEFFWYGSILNEMWKSNIGDAAIKSLSDDVQKMLELRIAARKGGSAVDAEVMSQLSSEVASAIGIESIDQLAILDRGAVVETATKAYGQKYGESLYMLAQGSPDYDIASNSLGLFNSDKIRQSLELIHMLLTMVNAEIKVTRERTLRLYRRAFVFRMRSALESLLHNISHIEDDMALLDRACALSTEVVSESRESNGQMSQDEVLKSCFYKVLARELEWRQASIMLFNLDPKSKNWLDLNDRLRFGLSEDAGAVKAVSTIGDVVLSRLQSMPPSQFADAMQCARWRAALYTIAGVADDPSLPWFTDFELRALTVTYNDMDVVRLGLDKRFHDWSEEYCERTQMDKISLFDITRCNDTIGSEFGHYQGTFYKGVKEKRRHQITADWQYGLNCRHESRYIKELLWRCLASSPESSYADLNRLSVNRALELASYTMDAESALEIEFSEWRLGYGGYSIQESLDRILQSCESEKAKSETEALLRSEFRWFGAMSTSFGRVGIFLMATLWCEDQGSNRVGLKELSFPSLSTMERCFLVSFTLLTNSKMTYKIGSVCQSFPPIGLAALASWRGGKATRWEPYSCSTQQLASDHIDIMHDIVLARELVAFYLDGRFMSHSRYLKNGSEEENPQNSTASCVNGWAAVDRIVELNLRQHRALSMDKNSIQAIRRLLSSTRNVKSLELYNCGLSGEQFLELMVSLKDCPHVERLDYGANHLTGPDVVAGLVGYVDPSINRGGIKKLGLVNCDLLSEDVVMIVKYLLEHSASLQINFGGNKLNDDGAFAIADLVEKCESLKLSASFSRNQISIYAAQERLLEAFIRRGATHFQSISYRNKFDDASGGIFIEV